MGPTTSVRHGGLLVGPTTSVRHGGFIGGSDHVGLTWGFIGGSENVGPTMGVYWWVRPRRSDVGRLLVGPTRSVALDVGRLLVGPTTSVLDVEVYWCGPTTNFRRGILVDFCKSAKTHKWERPCRSHENNVHWWVKRRGL